DFPVNRFVAGFVGTMNMLDGTVRGRDGGRLLLDLDGVGPLALATDATAAPHATTAPGARVAASFRPHTVRVAAVGASDEATDRFAWLDGTVQTREFLGEFTRYRIGVGTQTLFADQAHHAGIAQHEPGAAVRVGIDRSQVRLLAD